MLRNLSLFITTFYQISIYSYESFVECLVFYKLYRHKMWKTTATVIVTGIIIKYFLFYRDWLNLNREPILKVRPGPCQTLKKDSGSEDVIHVGDGIFMISSDFQFDKPTGDLLGVDINKNVRIFKINKTNLPDDEGNILAQPTGLSAWKDPATGRMFLYVITHPADMDKVRVFEVLKPLQLQYIKTITDPNFTFMNNIVAVGLHKFYITKYTPYRNKLHLQMEHLLHLKHGKILYFDGRRAREVSSNHYLPNGIAVSPDMKMIYLAEWGGQKLIGFNRDSSNNLNKVWTIDMNIGLDNINVDDNGDLWIATHEVTWKIIDFYNLFGATAPSQVIRVKIRDHAVSEIEEIYSDDGQECTGSTSASYANGKLVIGTFVHQTIVCDVKYLTK